MFKIGNWWPLSNTNLVVSQKLVGSLKYEGVVNFLHPYFLRIF
jgi:hypothetical protein